MYSYITHPMWTSPGIVVTRFDASTGTSIVVGGWPRGRVPVVHPGGTLRLPGAVRRAGGPPRPPPRAADGAADDRRSRRLVQGRLSGRRDRPDPRPARARVRQRRAVHGRWRGRLTTPFRGGVHRPARHRRRRSEARTSSTSGSRASATATDGADLRLRGRADRSIGVAAITGTVAAIAADTVARGGPTGVLPPEAAFEPRPFIDALAERALLVVER